MKGTERFKEVIKAYLDQRAATDSLFAAAYAKESKTLEECVNYICGEVQRSGMNGFADEEIFAMAVHYYDEDNIPEVKPVDGRVVVNHSVPLTEEEKAEAQREAIEQYRRECLNEERRKAAARMKKTKEKKPQEETQPMLFGL